MKVCARAPPARLLWSPAGCAAEASADFPVFPSALPRPLLRLQVRVRVGARSAVSAPDCAFCGECAPVGAASGFTANSSALPLHSAHSSALPPHPAHYSAVHPHSPHNVRTADLPRTNPSQGIQFRIVHRRRRYFSGPPSLRASLLAHAAPSGLASHPRGILLTGMLFSRKNTLFYGLVASCLTLAAACWVQCGRFFDAVEVDCFPSGEV